MAKESDPKFTDAIRPIHLAVCISLGAILWVLPTPTGLETKAWQCFAVFAATILALLLKPMPMGASVLLGVIVLAAGNVLGETSKESLSTALSGYGDTTTWLVVAAFLLGSAMVRSGLGRRIALGLAASLGKSVLGLAYAIAGAEFILGTMIPSNTARGGGVMAPIVNSLSMALGSSRDN